MSRDQEVKDDEVGKDGQEKEYKNVVQPPTRFSQSILWDWMRSFYEKSGVDAWSNGVVPFFITSNAYIAKNYAQLINAFADDLEASGQFDPSEPIHIIELGTGAGKLSFLLLKALEERHALVFGSEMYRTKPFRFKYVMTDFSSAPFGFWENHQSFQRYFSNGTLDYAKYDCVNDSSIHLVRSNRTIDYHSLKNPVVVVANYLFDSLPADSFQLRRGEWYSGLPAILSEKKVEDVTDPDLLNRFQARFYWDNVDNSIGNAFKEENEELKNHFETIFEWYKEHFFKMGDCDASLLVPTMSIRCLHRISKWCKTEGMMVVSGDKGSSLSSSMQGLYDPHIAIHGSFSLMVNYHMLALLFDSLGGFALNTPNEEVSLKVAVFIKPSQFEDSSESGSVGVTETSHWDFRCTPLPSRLRQYSQLTVAFHDGILAFGPDHFFYLQKNCDEGVLHETGIGVRRKKDLNQDTDDTESNLKGLTALLQLSDWDTDVFFKYRESILDYISLVGIRSQADLKLGLSRVWTNYFQLEKDKDIAFELGRVYYGMRELEKALLFYSKSLEVMGAHYVTEHNIGLCHYHLGNKTAAKASFARSIALNSSYSKAVMWHARLTTEQSFTHQPQDDNKAKRQQKGAYQVSIDPEVAARLAQSS